MEEGWKEVLFTGNDYLAYMARDILESAGIRAVVGDRQESLYRFGDYSVYVKEETESAALELLQNLKG